MPPLMPGTQTPEGADRMEAAIKAQGEAILVCANALCRNKDVLLTLLNLPKKALDNYVDDEEAQWIIEEIEEATKARNEADNELLLAAAGRDNPARND